jgi:asparagine synthase (glutamine-hydrolysing)
MWLEVRHWIIEQFRLILPGVFAAEEMDRQLLDSFDIAGQLQGRHLLHKSCYIHSKTCLPGVTLSSLGDRVEMAHSIESRLPFLDHRVVDFARRAPPSQKVRNGAEKFVLRKAMRTIVPPEICGRRKHPITAPPALWEHSIFGQLLQDTLRSRHLSSIPFINANALVGLLDAMAAQPPSARATIEAPMIALASAAVLAQTLSVS